MNLVKSVRFFSDFLDAHRVSIGESGAVSH